MIEQKIQEITESSVTTVLITSMTAAAGAINRMLPDLPVVHEVISDISMLAGIVACIMLARLHYLRGNNEEDERMRRNLHDIEAYERLQRADTKLKDEAL
jgi:hypothetical protein